MDAAIAKTHSDDVAKARDLLRAATTEADEAWVPVDAMIDALMLELIEQAGRRGVLGPVAAHLTRAAALAECRLTDHH